MCYRKLLNKAASLKSCNIYHNILSERGSLRNETYLDCVRYPKGCKVLFKARSSSLPIGDRVGSHGLSKTSKCVLCPGGNRETLYHIMFECVGYKEFFDPFFNFIEVNCTESYINKFRGETTDDDPKNLSKVGLLIRSRPDFTLAHQVPANKEDYEEWRKHLMKLFRRFQDVRAQSFELMWKYRTRVLHAKNKGKVFVTPGGKVVSISQNQNAGGDIVHTDNSMDDVSVAET